MCQGGWRITLLRQKDDYEGSMSKGLEETLTALYRWQLEDQALQVWPLNLFYNLLPYEAKKPNWPLRSVQCMYLLALEILLFWSLAFLLSGDLQNLAVPPRESSIRKEWPWSWNDLGAIATCVRILALSLLWWVWPPATFLSNFVPDFLHLKMVLYYLLQKATMHWMTPMLVRGGYLMHGAQYKMKIQDCLFKLHGAFQDGNSRALNQAQVLPSLSPVQLHGSHPWSWPWHSGSCHLP